MFRFYTSKKAFTLQIYYKSINPVDSNNDLAMSRTHERLVKNWLKFQRKVLNAPVQPVNKCTDDMQEIVALPDIQLSKNVT